MIFRWRHQWLLLPFMLLFFFLAVQSMVKDSPTIDEQNHIARGLALLKTGDARLSVEHPPLVNTISALPLLLLDIELPTDDLSWETGFWYGFADLLLWTYNQDATRMTFLSRMPILFLTLGLALVGYRFSRQLWGKKAASFTFLLLLFDPNILAHGRYSTTDVGGTLFSLLATYVLWRLWMGKGSWLLASLVLGLAFASKMSILGFVPIWGVIALLPFYENRWTAKTAVYRLLQFLSAGLLSIVVVWAAYGFEWNQFRFASEALQWLNDFRGPLPTFWAGIEGIALLINNGRFAAFLLGEFSETGFTSYFPVAFAAKTALPILVLLPIAIVLLLIRPDTRQRAGFLLGTAVLFFLLSIQSSLNIGYRHLLPMLPYLLILISGCALLQPKLGNERFAAIVSPLVLSVGLLWLLITTWQIHPHYLSYFNPLYGGPENGHNVLIDSNIDWGQDLLRLKKWMSDHNVPSVKLAWFGTADPDFYGINHEPLPGLGRHSFYSQWSNPSFTPAQPESGVYAISVNSYWEVPLPPDQKYVFQWFRTQPPSDRIGYSIFIYVVP